LFRWRFNSLRKHRSTDLQSRILSLTFLTILIHKSRVEAFKSVNDQITFGMRAALSAKYSAASDKRSKIEPFLMFCLHQRDELAARHPNFTCGELTSTLGAMWRTFSPGEKLGYIAAARRAAVDPI
jgi:hypothetical protein